MTRYLPGGATPRNPPGRRWRLSGTPPGPTAQWQTAVPAGAECGERPYWDGSGLVWVDIPAGRLHRYRPGHGDDIVTELRRGGAPVPLGAAAPRRGGGYVLATAEGFRLAGSLGELEEGAIRPLGMAADAEFNDGACDPAGRFWAGTVTPGYRPGAGALYRLDPDGTVTAMLDEVTESNGIGWSPDGTTMYFVDSGESEPRIRAFGFDLVGGNLGAARDLVRFPAGGAVPDGLVVDAEGCIWVAMWGGGEVRRYAPDGALLAVLPVPVSQPTCPAFGGPGLDELYLTSGWQGLTDAQREAEPLAGHVLHTSPGAQGMSVVAYG